MKQIIFLKGMYLEGSKDEISEQLKKLSFRYTYIKQVIDEKLAPVRNNRSRP